MPRYIDADTLRVPFVNWLNANMGTEAMRHLMQEVIDGIDEAPTVDAVEVVRCKDCKNWQQSVDGITKWCSVMRGRETKYDDFCSCGERREEDDA